MELFSNHSDGKTLTDKRIKYGYKRIYDAKYKRYDIEYKSSRFSKFTTDDEIAHIKLQIEKDIYYKGQDRANPCWVFEHNPKKCAKMLPLLQQLEDAEINYYVVDECPDFLSKLN